MRLTNPFPLWNASPAKRSERSAGEAFFPCAAIMSWAEGSGPQEPTPFLREWCPF